MTLSETLSADDPDVHKVFGVTATSGNLSFTPVVEVIGGQFADITGEWLGSPGLGRNLKVPLSTLPAGYMHRLRLKVPDDNDLELGYVILETSMSESEGPLPNTGLNAVGVALAAVDADPESEFRQQQDTRLSATIATGTVGKKDKLARTAIISVQNSTTSTVMKNAEFCWRVVFDSPIKSKRWRLRVRNYATNVETPINTGANFVPVYLGPANRDANGVYIPSYGGTAPTQVLPAFTLPSNGSEYVSGWVTDSDKQLDGRHMFSLGYTGGDTVTGQASGGGIIWAVPPAPGVTANVAAPTGVAIFSSTVTTPPFDIRVEVESDDAKGSGLVVGDSLAAVGEGGVTPHYLRWPELYARRTGHIIANVAVGSQKLSDYADASKWRYQRAIPANGYDYAIVMLGTNDIGLESASLATMQSRLHVVLANLRNVLNIPRVYVCTIPPRSLSHSRVVAQALAGSTTLTVMHNKGASWTARIGDGYTAETRTLTSPVASGPYTTYTLSSGLSNDHFVGEVLTDNADGLERTRLDFNAYVRSLPVGINGVIDADVAWMNPADRSVFRHDLVTLDKLHGRTEAQGVLAAAVPDLLL